MRGIDVFYQLCYFLSLNTRNAYVKDGGSRCCSGAVVVSFLSSSS
jgi:hypothetical protein